MAPSSLKVSVRHGRAERPFTVSKTATFATLAPLVIDAFELGAGSVVTFYYNFRMYRGSDNETTLESAGVKRNSRMEVMIGRRKRRAHFT